MPGFSALAVTTLLLGSPAPMEDLPWKLDRHHTYSWIVDSKRVGESVLTFSRVDDAEKSEYRLSVRRRYERKGNSMSVEGTLRFRPDGLPVSFQETCRLSSILSGMTGVQELSVDFSGTKVSSSFVNNRKVNEANRWEQQVPPRTYLFTSQALEHWVVLVLALNGKEEAEFDLFLPAHRTVAKLRVKLQGEEVVKIGETPTSAKRYRFDVTKPGYQGAVWVDGKGRLLQYESQSLTFVLAAPPEPPKRLKVK